MFQTAEQIRDFVLAGKAVLTLESEVSGQHYTYRVTQAKNDRGEKVSRWFVNLLTGPDNSSDYTYIGMIANGVFKLTAKSRLPETAAPVAGFRFMWGWVAHRVAMPPKMTIRHEGQCGRCGRPLTVPESIDSGYGPECIKKVGHVHSHAA